MHARVPVGRGQEAGEHVDRRRLAGAVGPEEREELPLFHAVPRALDRVEGPAPALEGGPQATDLDGRRRGHGLIQPRLREGLLRQDVLVRARLDHLDLVRDAGRGQPPVRRGEEVPGRLADSLRGDASVGKRKDPRLKDYSFDDRVRDMI